MTSNIKIAPSLLSADFSQLGEQIKLVEQGGADIIHFDVMDGHFVPNITIGPVVLKSIRKCTTLPIDVHLMITDPDQYITEFAKAGADMISVHVEVCNELHKTVTLIKENGCKAGVVLKPETPLSEIDTILPSIDFVLIMSVDPGFGGQALIPHTLDKISELRKTLDKKGLSHVDIEIDGGVKLDNFKRVKEAGANLIVSGSGIFKAEDPKAVIQAMKAL